MGQLLFYQFLIALARRNRRLTVKFLARLIGAAFFCLFPRRLKTSVRFYRALFPEKSSWYHLCSTWRQYQNFVDLFTERLFIDQQPDLVYCSQGWQAFEELRAAGCGAIVVMSHLGNWEVAARLFRQRNSQIPLLLLLGRKPDEKIESLQKSTIQNRGIQALTASPEQHGPLDILRPLQMLQAGGVVALTGDRIWHRRQRTVPAVFLGRRVCVPELPHRLALATGAPLFYFFGMKDQQQRFHFSLSAPVFVRAAHRRQRQMAVQTSAQAYARLLEQQVRRYPWQWYHFEPFW